MHGSQMQPTRAAMLTPSAPAGRTWGVQGWSRMSLPLMFAALAGRPDRSNMPTAPPVRTDLFAGPLGLYIPGVR